MPDQNSYKRHEVEKQNTYICTSRNNMWVDIAFKMGLAERFNFSF